MSFIVYIATNIINGKRYVGITSMPLRRRINSHFSASSRGSKTALHRAIHKHGRDSFIFEHVASCRSREDMQATEITLIAQENTTAPTGYNMTPGGDWYHVSMPPEARKRISEAKRQYWASRTPDQRRAFAEKISAARTGVKQPNSRGGTPLKGIKRSDEFRAKLSASLKKHHAQRKQRDNKVDNPAPML